MKVFTKKMMVLKTILTCDNLFPLPIMKMKIFVAFFCCSQIKDSLKYELFNQPILSCMDDSIIDSYQDYKDVNIFINDSHKSNDNDSIINIHKTDCKLASNVKVTQI